MDELEKILKETFLDEADQLLCDCEQKFLDLECDPSNPKIIEHIFRLAHSFKGSAGASGFEDLALVAHHLENLLVLIKTGKKTVSAEVVSLLLRANDELNRMVHALKQDMNARFTTATFIAEIDAVATSSEPMPAPEPCQGSKPELDTADDDSGFVNFSAPPPEKSTQTVTQAVTQIGTQTGTQTSTQTSAGDEGLRVSLRRIDELVNDVGELVILQTVLFQHRHEFSSTLLQKTISQLEKITRKVQDTSMGLRMVSIKPTFQKMQRIVRDSSQSLKKNIQLVTEGDDTEIDKTVLDNLSDPLVHLIRNAVDHGIETPADREEAGKASLGIVWLKAYHKGENLIIDIEDNGKGLNKDKLVAKAKSTGLLAQNAQISDEDAFKLIFASGFSTKDEITSISGRGVGMDVVKTNIEGIQGKIQIESVLGKGTLFRITLPLTLAIVDGLIIKAGDERFVVPLSAVQESIQPKAEDVSMVTGRGAYLNVRGVTIPLIRFVEVINRRAAPKPWETGIAIIATSKSGQPFALLVDDIVGQQQIVIKRLGPELHGHAGIVGAAILGDGGAALIIDMPDIAQSFVERANRSSFRKEVA